MAKKEEAQHDAEAVLESIGKDVERTNLVFFGSILLFVLMSMLEIERKLQTDIQLIVGLVFVGILFWQHDKILNAIRRHQEKKKAPSRRKQKVRGMVREPLAIKYPWERE